jgi:hypothetical protein
VHTTLSFRLFGVVRLVAALVGVIALVANFQYVLGFSTFAALNYFSYFSLAFPTSSQVLHFWLAGYVLVDWVFAPGRTPVRWRTLWLVLLYPLLWGWFTLARGQRVRWYPYFFLDPSQVDPQQFELYNGLVLAIFVGVLSGLIGLSRLRPSHLLRHRIAERMSSATQVQGVGEADGVGEAVDGARSK